MLNKGISFGFLAGVSNWIVAGVLVLVILAMFREKGKFARVGLLLIVSGGLWNLVMRVFVGGVVDPWPFFGLLYNNLADYLIVVGLMIYGYYNFVRR